MKEFKVVSDTEIIVDGRRFIALAEEIPQPEIPTEQTPEEWCKMIGLVGQLYWNPATLLGFMCNKSDWERLVNGQEIVNTILAYATRYYNTRHPMEVAVSCRVFHRDFEGNINYGDEWFSLERDDFPMYFHYFHREEDSNTTYAMIEALGLSEYLAVRTWEVQS